MANESLDFRVVKLAAGKSRFRAFLSVPVKSVGGDKCFGVLNFDFTRPDPFDKTDIAMAVVFGLLLGEELKRAA